MPRLPRLALVAVGLAAFAAACGGADPFVLADAGEPRVQQYGTSEDDVLLWASSLTSGSVSSGSTIGEMASAPAGGKDAYVRFLDSAGALVSHDQFGVEGDDAALGNDVDSSDSVYVAGYTNGSLAAEHQGSADVWVRRYSPDASVSWTIQAGGPLWDRAYGVVADDMGAFITGYTFGEFADNQVGEADAFVMRVAGDGTIEWLNQYGSPALDWGQGGAPAPDGGLYLVGFTEGDVAAPNAGERDAFIMAIGSDGSVANAAQFGSPGLDWATGVASTDAAVVIVGHTAGALAGEHQGESDVFVIALDHDLNEQWRLQFGTELQDQGYAIAAVDDTYVLTGYTLGQLGQSAHGDRDGIIAQISDTGELLSVSQIGSSAADETYGLTVVDDGILAVGYTLGDVASAPLGGTDIIEISYGGEPK